jgi:hypothetical protein
MTHLPAKQGNFLAEAQGAKKSHSNFFSLRLGALENFASA